MPERSVERSPCWPFGASFSHPPSQFHRTYLALITHWGRCCFNIDRICLCLTGGPRECPQLYSRPLPEHATCHHEAYRRATSVLAATDAGIFPSVPHFLPSFLQSRLSSSDGPTAAESGAVFYVMSFISTALSQVLA